MLMAASVSVTRMLAAGQEAGTDDPADLRSIRADAEDRDAGGVDADLDNWAEPRARRWGETVGKSELFRRPCMPLRPMYGINKVIPAREIQPDIFSREWKFLCTKTL